MNPKQSTIERALDGYRQLVEILSASRVSEFPDPGITMAQMRVLMVLNAVGEARMSDLAAQLGISLSTLSSLVDRLVESGFAQRGEDPHDRRSVLVSLTPAGVGLLDTFQELGIQHLRALLGELTAKDAQTVTNAIDLLVAAARRMTSEETS